MTPKGTLQDFVADLSEKEVEHQCDNLMKSLGWTIVRFSQARATKQTRGIPDRRYYPPKDAPAIAPEVWPLAFWFECKKSGGKQSVYQAEFEKMCTSAGDHYVLGGLKELAQYLREQGIKEVGIW